MSVYQLKLFGMTCVDFYFKLIPIFILFSRSSQKRSHFGLRVAAVIPALLLLCRALVQLPVFRVFDMYMFLIYILLFAGLFLVGKLLYNAPAYSILFNILGGHALNQVLLLLLTLLRSPIPEFRTMEQATVAYYTIELVWFTAGYALCDFLFLRKLHVEPAGRTGQLPLYISLGISLFLIEFNLVRSMEIEQGGKIDILCILCIILFYILILLLRSGILLRLEKEKELALREQVWAKKEKSLRLTREAIETINIKYHDLRRIASRIRHGKDVLDLADSLTESLERYERSYATGNDTLDMILTDEHLRLYREGVSFVCMVDGSALGFLSSLDIISVFSNALDNALEAVTALPKEEREIRMTVKKAIGTLSICVENPYAAKLEIVNGIPATTKSDRRFHGFGMRSIQSTVEKYSGTMDIDTKEGRFKLMIMIPIPDVT